MPTSRRTTASLLTGLAIAISACGGADAPEVVPDAAAPAATAAETDGADVAALREVAARYRDVNVALEEGYLRDPSNMCVTAEMEGMDPALGAMGIHYFRPDLLGIVQTEPRVAGTGTHTDFSQPGVLIYEPQADGSLELVAIENVVFQSGWEAAQQPAPPSYMGNEYVHMVDDPATGPDEAHGFEPHYELHAWVVRDNPNGMFAPHNPNVTCEHHGHTGA
jgi:hypothetical protein